jgi:hypothetical protein
MYSGTEYKVTLSIRFGQRLDTASMLTLQMIQRPRWRHPSNELALVTALGF